jgi:hypothetical protein
VQVLGTVTSLLGGEETELPHDALYAVSANSKARNLFIRKSHNMGRREAALRKMKSS